MQKSGFKLTITDLGLLEDNVFLPAKRRLMEKLELMLGELGDSLAAEPAMVAWCRRLERSPYYKITKGENYRDLPYIVMDLPRIDTQYEMNMIRIMIWWGKFASVNLFLAGDEWERVKPHLKSQQHDEFRINQDEIWENDLDYSGYVTLKEMTESGQNWARISLKVELQSLDALHSKVIEMLHLVRD